MCNEQRKSAMYNGNEQWKCAMSNGNLQCAMEMCNGNVVCALKMCFNVQWKCGVVCGVVLGVCSVVRFVWCVMCCSMKQAIHLFVGGITIL